MFHKKGDVVRIRDDLKTGEFYGSSQIKMIYDMEEALGKVGVITDIDRKELAVKVLGWWWSVDMIHLLYTAVPSKHWIPTDIITPPADPDARYFVICENKKGRRSINLAWIDEKGDWHGQGSFSKVTHWMTVQLPEVAK